VLLGKAEEEEGKDVDPYTVLAGNVDPYTVVAGRLDPYTEGRADVPYTVVAGRAAVPYTVVEGKEAPYEP